MFAVRWGPAREDLSVRLGIASGLAVVGDLIGAGAAQERGVVGETPNLAARLQGLAMPNTLVIAEATRRQIGGLFDLADLGAQQLAGFAEPQRAWRDAHRDTVGLRAFLEKRVYNAPFGILVTQSDDAVAADSRIVTLLLSSFLWMR